MILISAAAGAVGQMVGQIAVREGLHVGCTPIPAPAPAGGAVLTILIRCALFVAIIHG